MFRLTSILLLLIALLSVSCDLDQCEQTITYTKAIGVYVDMDEVRSQELIEPARFDIENPGKIYLNEDLILISEKGKGVHVIDNSIPSNPTNVRFVNVPGSYEMYVDRGYLYINSYMDMVKIDISDPTNIKVVDRIPDAFSHLGLTDNEGRLLVGFDYQEVTEVQDCDYNAYHDDQIYYFDYQGILLEESAIPTSFVSSGSTVGTANRMARIEDQLFVVNTTDLYAFDISTDQLSESRTIDRQQYVGWNVETIYAMNPFLFIGTQTGMQIHEVSPNGINSQGAFSHAEACDPVLPTVEGVAYVTLRSGDECPGDLNSINVVDISNVRFPFLIDQFALDSPYGMTIIGDLLYVAQGDNGFSIFDKTNPEAIIFLRAVSDIEAYDIIRHPTRTDLVLIANKTGLSQYAVTTDQDFSTISTIGF